MKSGESDQFDHNLVFFYTKHFIYFSLIPCRIYIELRHENPFLNIYAKTKAQISCSVTAQLISTLWDIESREIVLSMFAQLICAFDFAYTKSRFSHDAAHIIGKQRYSCTNCICFGN